jgi:pyruvate,water dikinase
MAQRVRGSPYVRWFADAGIEDVPEVGGKNASLGEMIRELSSSGVKVPDGFAVTTEAYRVFLQHSSLDRSIPQMLAGLDPRDVDELHDRGFRVRHAILSLPFPPALEDAILDAYDRLSAENRAPVDVAVRSSATAEDLPDASFAGQQETYLNVQGRVALLDACKRCFASLFTDRAISYRSDRGFDVSRVALSVGVQRMVAPTWRSRA